MCHISLSNLVFIVYIWYHNPMKIIIESVKVDLTEALLQTIEKKFMTLEKLVSRFEEAGEATLQIEIARTTRHHNKGDEVYRVMADLRIPKKAIRAEALGAKLPIVIADAKETLKMEIENYKEKIVGAVKGK